VPVDTSGALAGKTLTQISVVGFDVCALDSADAVFCWGSNYQGGLGDGGTADSSVPVAVDTGGVLAGKTLTQVSAGYYGACVLDTAGAAFCWGDNVAGGLGNGSTVSSSVPVAVHTSGVLAGNNAPADLAACTGSARQHWQPHDGALVNQASAKCLDDPRFNVTDGTPLGIYTCNGGANQHWNLP
jgi:Regulator of chromosome condensation (RCC1) repeat